MPCSERKSNNGTGGLAGCVVAGRLAEADPDLSILVIEQGLNNYGAPEVVHPALYPRNLFPNSKYTLFWQGNQSPQLADRKPIVPSGGTLGGGSSINWMVYTRGQRSDYDSWKTKGWAADDMLPFMKKVNILQCIFVGTSADSVLVRELPRPGRQRSPRRQWPGQHLKGHSLLQESRAVLHRLG